MLIGSVKPLYTRVQSPAFLAASRARKPSSMTSAATNDVIAPLVTLLRNALPGSDRENVRQAQGLAAHRNPLQQITNHIPPRNRPCSNRHILVMYPDHGNPYFWEIPLF